MDPFHARWLRDRRTHALDQPLDRIDLAGSEPAELGLTWSRPRFQATLGIPSDAEVDHAPSALRSKVHEFEEQSGVDIELLIGEYGIQLARAQVQAARALVHLVETRMRPDADALAQAHGPLLAAWTYQGTSVVGSLKEGITSIAQAVAVATSRRIDGMEAAEVVHGLSQSHVIDRLAKGPMGFVAPINQAGLLVDDPLVIGRSGELRVGAGLEALLRRVGQLRQQAPAPAVTTHAGCPLSLPRRSVELGDGSVATPQTMLGDLAREYLHLVGRYLASGTSAAS